MATHSNVLAWRIPGIREPGGLPSMGSHRVGHDWRDLAAAAAANPAPLHWATFPRAISILELWCASESPGRFLKPQILWAPPLASDSLDLGWGEGACAFAFPTSCQLMTMLLVQGPPPLWESHPERTHKCRHRSPALLPSGHMKTSDKGRKQSSADPVCPSWINFFTFLIVGR